MPAGAPLEEGIGLSNTRARLEQLYGPAQVFVLHNAASGGLEVRIVVPFRVETDGPTGAESTRGKNRRE